MLLSLINSKHEVAHFICPETDMKYDLPVIGFGLFRNPEDDGGETFICGIVIHNGELCPAEFIDGFTHYSNVNEVLH